MPTLNINGIIIKTMIFDFDGNLAKLNIDFHQMRQTILTLTNNKLLFIESWN